MIKIHLGCGEKILDGFVNIDIVQKNSRVVIDDVSTLSTIKNNSVDLIYACHVLEHFPKGEILYILKVWNNKMKRGGTIRISVPDFNSIVLQYEKSRNLNSVIGLLYGGQRNEYDYHKVVFNFDTLSNLLEMAGFSNVRRYDWRETEHFDVDDYSQAYLPHLEKETGLLMSLNVEATKK